MPIYSDKDLTDALVDGSISDEEYKRLIFLYENHFSDYTAFYYDDETAEDEFYISFDYEAFLSEWDRSFHGELLENCIILIAKLEIGSVIIYLEKSVSKETREYLEWFFKFFYYQNSEGLKSEEEILKPVFEARFIPYKFDYSELTYDTELNIIFEEKEI